MLLKGILILSKIFLEYFNNLLHFKSYRRFFIKIQKKLKSDTKSTLYFLDLVSRTKNGVFW